MTNENRYVIYKPDKYKPDNNKPNTICIKIIYCCRECEYEYVTNVHILSYEQIVKLKNYNENYPYDDLDFFNLLETKPTNKEHFNNCSIKIYNVIC